MDKGRHQRPTVFRTIFVHLVGGEQPRRVGRHEFRRLFRLAERDEDCLHRVTAALVIREVGPEVGLHFALVVQGLLRFRAEAHIAVRPTERDTIAMVLLVERIALFAVLLHEEAAFRGLDGVEVLHAHVVGGHVCDCVAIACVLQLFLGDGFSLRGWVVSIFSKEGATLSLSPLEGTQLSPISMGPSRASTNKKQGVSLFFIFMCSDFLLFCCFVVFLLFCCFFVVLSIIFF